MVKLSGPVVDNVTLVASGGQRELNCSFFCAGQAPLSHLLEQFLNGFSFGTAGGHRAPLSVGVESLSSIALRAMYSRLVLEWS